MSGPGHSFPGGFPGTPTHRTNFANPLGSSGMPPQLAGMMNGQMGSSPGMVGMNTQMNQSYATNMQNQMGSMAGMPTQTMSVGNSSPSPNQGATNMGMGPITPMGPNANMAGTMAGSGMGSVMANTGIGANMGMPNSALSNNAMNTNSAMQNTLNSNVSVMGANTNVSVNQTVNMNNQVSQTINQPQPNKEFNTASLCRFGQETVQDIVSRTQEVFQTLKAIQPPNGTAQGTNTSNEKKAKIQEQLRTIRLLFKRLRLIYEKCNQNCQVPGMEYTHIESLIPLKDEYEHKTIDEKKTSETYKLVCEENRELTEQVVLKNKQIKEVINNLRMIIWEINVMLTMRRS